MVGKQESDHLLPPDALRGITLGISVSDSPDLAQLGLLEIHFRLALAEIARSVLVSGGRLAYGGHLEPDGYTSFLVRELQRYSRRDKPISLFLAWQEHRRFSIPDLIQFEGDLGLHGSITFLNPKGQKIHPFDGRTNEPVIESDPEIRRISLTAMRKHMAENIHGRILIGGKRTGFQGDVPGIIEEAIISMELNQPLFLVGGFGGVTHDIVSALKIDDAAWLPKNPAATEPDRRMIEGIERLMSVAAKKDRLWLNNGLTEDENKKLAATYRPSEIAALISLGLGRLSSASTTR